MRIAIDMQGAQYGNRQHGIGRHTLSLALAIARNRGTHEVFLALNGLLPDTIATIRAMFDGLLPQENIRVWQAPGPVYGLSTANDWRRRTAELVREAFLASLKPDMVIVTSLFEGLSEDAVTSIGTLNCATPTAAILYGLIPHIHRYPHPENPAAEAWYENKLQHLRRADLLFAVSESSRQQAIRYLGMADEACANIATASIAKKSAQHDKQLSWDAGAQRVIAAVEAWHLKQGGRALADALPACRPRLAYVSPLPPERSGISDYSAELLPELSRYYDIDVIVAQDSVSDPWVKANCALRCAAWLRDHADQYDRVLYHFGNSPFHQHMFGLLEEVPGVVVLHDFFLAHIVAHLDMSGYRPGALAGALYRSHGYGAVQQYFHAPDAAEAIWRYPCNLDVLQGAQGVIVHSASSLRLARQWYGNGTIEDWAVVPHLRVPASAIDRAGARRRLDLDDDAFVVCSFGLLGPNKLNHRLLDAWLASDLAKDAKCVLVFVGENHRSDYGGELVARIRRSGLGERIRITGWADTATFRHYLAAADAGVQLRELSRGETSGTVLDCMNYGLPAIVNAHGSMADLPDDAVWKLPDEFSDAELVMALETLWRDVPRRRQLGNRAREIIVARHAPQICAGQYAQAIETMYRTAGANVPALSRALAGVEPPPADAQAWTSLAAARALSIPPMFTPRQLLVDVSNISRNDLKTGIERVVRAQLLELIKNPPENFRIEPVYLTDRGGQWHYRYARSYTCKILGIEQANLSDAPIDINQGDVFYAPDFFPGGVIEAARSGVYSKWKAAGVSINFLVHDLLPILRPEFFPDGASIPHAAWLKAIALSSTRLICISNAVADELRLWLKNNAPARNTPPMIDVVHHGADIAASAPTAGLPGNAGRLLKKIGATPTFLMVGTLEPRKGHSHALSAFECLWEEGHQVSLVIVGKEGWTSLPDDQRRSIPQIVARLREHKESGKRLFWLEGISDEFLEKTYAASTALIAASLDEGFGLPLIEAAQHKLPVIARDIPVFREVAQEHALYFSGLEPQDLADAVKQWLALNAAGKAPQSDGMPWLTWEQSARDLVRAMTAPRGEKIQGSAD